MQKNTGNAKKKFYEKIRRSVLFEALQVVQITFPLLDLVAVGLLISFYFNEDIANASHARGTTLDSFSQFGLLFYNGVLKQSTNRYGMSICSSR